jgi:hypothetical protein
MVAQYAQNVRSIRLSLRSGPPGVGKTFKLSKDWERFPGKKLLLSHSHEYLTEQEKRWSERMEVRQLWGLRWICPCVTTEEYYNEVIAKLVELKLPHSYVCGTCNLLKAYPQNSCPYQQQSKNLPNVVIAPIEYVFTNLLDEYKPDFIAVDDCTLKMRKHPTRQTLEHFLQHLQHMYYGAEHVRKHGVANLRELFSLNEKDYQSFMKKMWNTHRTYLKDNVEEIVKNYAKSELFLHVAISPDEFDTYRKHAHIYGYKNRFATPDLFPLFDYVAKCKSENNDEPLLKIIDAIIKHEIFIGLRTRYLCQENVYIDFRDDGFEYTIEDKGSVVYRCRGTRSDAWYPTTGSIVKDPMTRQRIRQWIAWILKTWYNSGEGMKIGLVIPKRCGRRQFISSELKIRDEQVKVLTFGNLRGKNYLEDCDIAFIIGTYNTNHEELIEDFSLMFAYEPTSKDYVENKRHGGRYRFKDRELNAYRWAHEEYEQYQAFHRVRPLLHKKQIYGFCLIPEEIKRKGLRVKNYELKKGGGGLKRSEWLLDYVKQGGKVLMRETSFVIKDEFKISLVAAYKLIHKVVDNSKRLSIILIEGRQWLVYESE